LSLSEAGEESVKSGRVPLDVELDRGPVGATRGGAVQETDVVVAVAGHHDLNVFGDPIGDAEVAFGDRGGELAVG
jgi:hypothetical protein